jgi:uncharacterized protein (TIGR03086 family)
VTAPDSLALLERALDQAAAVIAGVAPGQAGLPTPCSDWDVGALLRHMVGQDLRNFTVAARGETADWSAPADDPGDDWASAFRDGADRLLDTWRGADLDRPVSVPAGGEAPLRSRADHQITELVVHTWDLAQGHRSDHAARPGAGRARARLVAAHAEARGSGKAFGAEVPVDESAPPYDRLAAWFGRAPAWPAGRSAG